MNYLIDTNVVSEFNKPVPNEGVQSWLKAHQRDNLFLSVITIGEIQHGIFRLAASPKRQRLVEWLNGRLLVEYANFIILIDPKIMLKWGALTAKLRQAGKKMPIMDGLIAATAVTHQLTLVTRNEPDFAETGLPMINPWH